MKNYELYKQLKEVGFPQKEDKLYCAEDFKGMILRDIVDTLSRVEGQHRTFDYSIYPEPNPDDWSQGKARNSYYFSKEYLKSEEGKKYTIYLPTLSELIDACGEELIAMVRWWKGKKLDGWGVTYLKEPIDSFSSLIEGETLTEAVAKLYIALNE